MGYKITIKQGNMLDESADFIVNASNTRLILGSGVSLAFKRHCGVELQDEMDDILRKIGSDLVQGDVVASSSAKANNFKYALHVAVMNYNKGVKYNQKYPTLQTIQKSLESIENYLIWYSKYKTNSIKLVLPLIGCGVGGLKKDDVLKIYKKFFSARIEFECEVVIYGFTTEDYQKITKFWFEKNKDLKS